MHKITPFLWFESKPEEAAKFYCSVFKNAKMGNVSRYPEGSPHKAGEVMTVSFELEGQPFTAINGGAGFPMTGAISFVIDCADQAEVDYYWEKLSEGGKELQCAWLTDRFGITWQVVPSKLPELLGGEDKEGAARAMAAMMKMVKIDIAEMERAYRGE
jgi:predicted 3-demethylubiquinone-9 3-methyltransferase (glyoxalase superfamily)